LARGSSTRRRVNLSRGDVIPLRFIKVEDLEDSGSPPMYREFLPACSCENSNSPSKTACPHASDRHHRSHRSQVGGLTAFPSLHFHSFPLVSPFFTEEEGAFLHKKKLERDLQPPLPPIGNLSAANPLSPPLLPVPHSNSMARKERRNSAVGGKPLAGYCECCLTKYEDMEQHLLTPKHVEFFSNPANYKVIDEHSVVA